MKMKLKESKVIEIMKDKMERFNQDDELRLAAYNRELNIYAHEMELEESYQNGKKACSLKRRMKNLISW